MNIFTLFCLESTRIVHNFAYILCSVAFFSSAFSLALFSNSLEIVCIAWWEHTCMCSFTSKLFLFKYYMYVCMTFHMHVIDLDLWLRIYMCRQLGTYENSIICIEYKIYFWFHNFLSIKKLWNKFNLFFLIFVCFFQSSVQVTFDRLKPGSTPPKFQSVQAVAGPKDHLVSPVLGIHNNMMYGSQVWLWAQEWI